MMRAFRRDPDGVVLVIVALTVVVAPLVTLVTGCLP